MKKIAAALAATALAALALVAPISPAAAYPDPVCTVSVSSTQVRAGEPFTVTVTSDIPADLTATYRGVTRSASQTLQLVAQFVAPQTDRDLQTTVTTTCNGQPGSTAGVTVIGSGGGGGDDADADGGADSDADGGVNADADGGVNADAGNTDAAADADADAGDANGILPGTGGTDFWLLVLGALLVIAGVGTVVARRRRS